MYGMGRGDCARLVEEKSLVFMRVWWVLGWGGGLTRGFWVVFGKNSFGVAVGERTPGAKAHFSAGPGRAKAEALAYPEAKAKAGSSAALGMGRRKGKGKGKGESRSAGAPDSMGGW